MPSLESSTAKERLHLSITAFIYLFICQIILVLALVLVLLAGVELADNSVSLM